MKKLISILLVAMLVISMFPAIVSAEATTETITFDASKTQRVSQNTTSQVWKSEHITFTNNKASSSSNVADYANPVRLYAGSELIIECNAGKMTSIVFVSNGTNSYKTALKNSLDKTGESYTVDGNNYTVTFASDVDSFTFSCTGQIRLQSITVNYEASASTEPDCEHTNKTTVTVPATCTEDGSTTVTCDDCGKTVSEETIYALGHNYVDGKCTACGADQPKGYVLIDDITAIKSAKNLIIVSTKGTDTPYAMSNNNGTDKAPAVVAVTVTGNTVETDNANVLWDFENTNDGLVFYKAGTTDTWLYCTNTNNGVRVGSNTASYFELDTTTGYLKHTGTSRYVGVYNDADWRCYTNTTGNTAGQTFKFYAESVTYPTCDHQWGEGEITTAPGCETEGERTFTCALCRETKTEVEAALGHNYVEDVCSRCGDVRFDPVGRYYIATIRSSGNYFYMTDDLGTASTKRFQAVDTGFTKLPDAIYYTDAATQGQFVFEIFNTGSDTYYIKAEGVDAEEAYVGVGSNAGKFVTEDEAKANPFTLVVNEDGTVKFQQGDRFLSLNATTGNNYFGWYTGTQRDDLTLIPVVNSVDKALDKDITTVQYAAGAEMPFEVDVDGTTYIGLANETDEFYTYYKLDLKMSSISLRASEAGIYYGAKVTCDDALAAAVDSYGIVLSTAAINTEDPFDGNPFTVIECEEGEFDTSKTIMSGSVFNIFKEGLGATDNQGRGTSAIYAVVYLEIDGQYVISKQEISWSLQKVLKTINDRLAAGTLTLKTNEQNNELVNFYQKWADEKQVIDTWELDAIAALTLK